MRLCRLICGKPLAFRANFLYFLFSRWRSSASPPREVVLQSSSERQSLSTHREAGPPIPKNEAGASTFRLCYADQKRMQDRNATSLFPEMSEHQDASTGSRTAAPLADRMRPRTLSEFVGQEHLVGQGRVLRRLIESGGTMPSIILWGPPGTGKTTLARLLAEKTDARFVALSAVFSGVKDLRAAIAEARLDRQRRRRTILFID